MTQALTFRITGPYTEFVDPRTGMVKARIPTRNMTETPAKMIARILEQGR